MNNNIIAIVVDTDVVRSASGSSKGHARLCANILDAILKQEIFILALSPELKQEYLRKRSNTSKVGWSIYISRYAFEVFTALKNKNRVKDNYVLDRELGRKILDSLNPATRKRAEKDLPVLLTALSADQRLISNNRRERELFRRACDKVPELRSLLWPDPIDRVPKWLRNKAPETPHYRLCHNISQLQHNPRG